MKKKFILIFFLSISSLVYSVVYELGPTPNNPGFFSVFYTVVGALDFYDTCTDDCTGIVVDFKKQGLYYDVNYGSNWWSYYFMPIILGVDYTKRKLFPQERHDPLSRIAAFHLSKERVHELIKKYIRLQPHIQKKIDQFIHEHFEGHRVIGVHYRGTDKFSEAPVVRYDVVIALIKEELEKDPEAKIFVATDEQRFLQAMHRNFPGKILALDALRSQSGFPVHYASHGGAYNYKKGEDAVIDCILLSRCSKLYRTSSNLSSASTRFNPSLDVVVLSKGAHEFNQ